MPCLKPFISIVAIALTFIGYVPYVRDILKGKTKPHVFSWLIWGITTSLICALQVASGAGSGAWITMALLAVLLCVFILSLKNGNKNIKKIDGVFLILALSALPLWLVVHQPVLSIILLCTIDVLGFIPTIRKSWDDPYSETLSLYTITTFRYILSFVALADYNIMTYLFPITWIFANAFFSVLLIVRRRQVRK